MNENEKELMNELENQKRLRQPHGYGKFIGLSTNMVIYDDCMGQMYPHLGMPDAIKELINDEHGLAIEREGFEMNSKETEMRLNEMRKVIQKDTNDKSRRPASDGFREWINEFQKGLHQGIRDVETGLRQQKNYSQGERIDTIVYDPDVMLQHPYVAIPDEKKESLSDTQRLPNLITEECIQELKEQVQILKDFIGLTESELTAKLLARSVTPNQIRSIMGVDKINKSHERFTVEEVLTRADVEWYDDIMNNARIVISKNREQPLNSLERQAIYDMWKSQYRGLMKCIFYEQAGPNSKKKLVDEFPKIGGTHFEF